MRDDYLIEYESISNNSLRAFLDLMNSKQGKKLNDLKIRDLSYYNGAEIWPGEGVYLFRNDTDVIYVGKVSSMSFTERIGKHFDHRHWAWFNRLLELLCKEILHLEWNDDNANLASKHAFENLNIILINFKTRDKINRTERLLRAALEPLNKFKRLKHRDFEIVLKDH